MINHVGLFEGIGGFSLAAALMGWKTIAWSENKPFCRTILKYYFPNATGHGDIRKTDFSIYRDRCRIVTGGFPCQPYSLTGKREGTDDDRHLWPEMHRAIREIAPAWVLAENVPGLLNWNGGVVLKEVLSDLENEGYEAQVIVLPACSVEAPHRRDRVWIVAYSHDNGKRTARCGGSTEKGGEAPIFQENEGWEGPKFQPDRLRYILWDDSDSKGRYDRRFEQGEDKGQTSEFRKRIVENFAPDSIIIPSQGDVWEHERSFYGESGEWERFGELERAIATPERWREFPTESPIFRRTNGISERMDSFVVDEFYAKIEKKYTSQDLSEMWKAVSSEKVWEQVRGLYSLDKKEVLFKTMQLYSSERRMQKHLSPFSEKFSEKIMQHLRKYGQFRCSPQGRKLEKQRSEQLGDSMPFLPHEIALAAGRFEAAITKFETWHRREAISGYGNAVVPQLVYQIFKVIEKIDMTYGG